MKLAVALVSLFFIGFMAFPEKEKSVSKQKVKKSPDREQETLVTEIGFPCAKVETATSLLPDTTYQLVLEDKTGKKVFVYDEKNSPTELVPTHMNAFVNMVYRAFADHRPLEISPDMIWLLIAQGVAIHVNENHDKLKSKLFTQNDPVEIFIRNDDLLKKTPESWKKLTGDFSASVDKYTRTNIRSMLVPEFTTTTPSITTVYEVTMLETVKKSFFFIGGSGCGIPFITLKGTKNDWEKIYSKLEELRIFGLDQWIDNLKPILQEFINAYDNKIDKKFWNAIYKEESYYGTHHVSGWMIKFFPYIKTEYLADTVTYLGGEKYEWNPYLEGENYLLSELSNDNFPGGVCKVPMTWKIFDPLTGKLKETKPLLLTGGFIGIKQNKETKALTTEINWAICDTARIEESVWLDGTARNEMDHNDELWTTEICDSVEYKPVFDSLKNKTYDKGIVDFKQRLYTQLKKHPELTNILKRGLSFKAIITSQGTMAQISFINQNLKPKEKQLILSEILTLSKNWSPPRKYLRPRPMREEPGLYRVNYPLTIHIKS